MKQRCKDLSYNVSILISWNTELIGKTETQLSMNDMPLLNNATFTNIPAH